jgi:proline iminopeptidase
MKTVAALALGAFMLAGGSPAAERDDVLSGGVRMIPIQTPKGAFRVWTKRVGANPTMKVLLLHGGPGFTHEYFEAFDSYLPAAGIEYYYYDQLGSAYSDQPDDPDLWELPRFVEEVEQVRQALGLGKDDFYLLGHSWGGILAMEYALKYQQHLKGLVISNMMASIPAYNEYARTALMPSMDQSVLGEIQRLEAAKQNENPRYMELLIPHHYEKHILRMPADQWPEPVNRSFKHMNPKIYVPMQGPSELAASGKLEKWDRTADLGKITVPTLVIGARHDTMDPAHMERMARQVRNGRYLFLPNGSHMAMYDDQKAYFDGLIRFVRDVDGGRSTAAPDDFEAMLARVDAAQLELHNGRTAAYKALWSHADDITLSGGFGGTIEKGWAAIGPRLDWVGTQFSNGSATRERIASNVSGDLGYLVQLEHIRFQVPGTTTPASRDFRVTMLFRREPEGWRMIHRQADSNLTKQPVH